EEQQKKGGGKGGKGQPKDGGKAGDPRVFSPDKKFHTYALNHNLYLVEEGKEDEATIQLSKDSADQYTFNQAGGGFGSGIGGAVADQKTLEKDKDKKIRPNVVWSKDSKVFYATRSDSRGIRELFLVNNVANPRPTLSRYTYPMPGD